MFGFWNWIEDSVVLLTNQVYPYKSMFTVVCVTSRFSFFNENFENVTHMFIMSFLQIVGWKTPEKTFNIIEYSAYAHVYVECFSLLTDTLLEYRNKQLLFVSVDFYTILRYLKSLKMFKGKSVFWHLSLFCNSCKLFPC